MGLVFEWSERKAAENARKHGVMSEDSDKIDDDEMLSEYDFSKGVQAKYAAHFAEGTTLVVLEPDVAEEFPDSEAVNEALRGLIEARKNKRGRESD